MTNLGSYILVLWHRIFRSWFHNTITISIHRRDCPTGNLIRKQVINVTPGFSGRTIFHKTTGIAHRDNVAWQSRLISGFALTWMH